MPLNQVDISMMQDIPAPGVSGKIIISDGTDWTSGENAPIVDLSQLSASNLTTGTVATARLGTGTADSTKFLRGDNTWQVVAMGATQLDLPTVTGTFSLLSGGSVTHTITNWSDDLSWTITPTNCTVGSVNASGEFVVTHTSGLPSYTIVATTSSLGLADSNTVTKNLVMQLTAPTLSSPADVGTSVDVTYTITSTTADDDKLILDPNTANFTYQSVSGGGTASKVGNTVECVGFTTNNPVVTIQYTVEATYSVTATSVNVAGTYSTSPSSSADSITISNGYNAHFLVLAGGGTSGAGGTAFNGSGMAGGAGAGGLRTSWAGGSGGGAGSQAQAVFQSGQVYTCTVAGAAHNVVNTRTDGNPSLLSGSGVYISCTGGGHGALGTYNAGNPGTGTGGSGGCGGAALLAAGSGTAGEGYDAGWYANASWTTGGYSGGGGTAQVGQSPKNGGNGKQVDIDGNNYYWGGGGGSANHGYGGGGGSGGLGGGGGGTPSGSGGGSGINAGGNAGGQTGGQGGSGGANTGGGGGGPADNIYTASSGGSGIIILRMATADYSGTTSGSPSVTTVGSDTVITFTGTGTYTA